MVQELVDNLFCHRSIVKKKVNGKLMSGKDFANLALTFVEAFESGKVPPPETIFQV